MPLNFKMTFEELFTLKNLNNAFYESEKASYWKESTQRYKANLLINNVNLQEELLNGTYKLSQANKFKINERGKVRQIEAPSQRDRIVQKVLCKQVLIPQLTRYLIYDNYASLTNRGTSFARKRIEVMLRRYIREHGTDGYVLKIDIKKFFESIDHDKLKELVHAKLKADKRTFELIDYIIDNSSDSNKGLNLGAEAPQILAIFYLYRLDNYIKIVKGIKYYGRYMDDMFVLGSKEELKSLLEEVKLQLKDLKLEINEQKTQIVKLTHGFTFMQIKYSFDGSKIIKRPTRAKLVRERKRMKKHRDLCDRHEMTENDAHNCYLSWRNNLLKECNRCEKTITNMNGLFASLFNVKDLPRARRSNLITQISKGENYEIYCQHRREQLHYRIRLVA